MKSIILCCFVFCTLQLITLPTNAQHEDVLNEYVPIFRRLNGIYGGVAEGTNGANYVFRTRRGRVVTDLRTKAKSISSEKILKINEEIESLTKYCQYDKDKCLKLKNLDIGNFTIKTEAGFDTCTSVYINETVVSMEYLTEVYAEVSRIDKLVQAAKQNCTENISSDEKVRLCLFKNLYSNVLPPLDTLKNIDYYKKLTTEYDIAESVVNNCYDIAEDVVVNYYAEQVVNNFKYCCQGW